MKTYLDSAVPSPTPTVNGKLIEDLRNQTRILFRDFPTIMYSGLAGLIGFGIALILMQVDDRTVLGINTWIKPAKFLLSGGVYLLTMGWVFSKLSAWNPKKSLRMSQWMAWLLNVEVALIVMQGARGVRSHYNISTPLDGIIFSVMGVLILVSSLILIRMFVLSVRKPLPIAPPMLWAIRIGLLLLILSAFEGGFMSQNFQHTVGAADGGAGILFFNWSTEGGDLRIAHFFGMHGIQLFAILGFWLHSRKVSAAKNIVIATGILYSFLCLGTFVHAMMGYPLLG